MLIALLNMKTHFIKINAISSKCELLNETKSSSMLITEIVETEIVTIRSVYYENVLAE